MSLYSQTSLSSSQLLKHAWYYYPQALKSTVVFILLWSVLQAGYFFALVPYIDIWIARVIFFMLLLYFVSASLYATHQALLQIKTGVVTCAWQALKRWPRVLLYALLYVAIFVVMMYALHGLIYLGERWHFIGDWQGWWDLLLIGAPLLLINLLVLMALPLLVISDHRFLDCIKASARLAWQHRFKPVFLVYFMISVVIYLLLPETRHGFWLMEQHIKSVFDLLVYLLFVPFIVNYTLLLVRGCLATRY